MPDNSNINLLGFRKLDKPLAYLPSVTSFSGVTKYALDDSFSASNIPEAAIRFDILRSRIGNANSAGGPGLTKSSAARLTKIWNKVYTDKTTVEDISSAASRLSSYDARPLKSLLVEKAWGRATGFNPIRINTNRNSLMELSFLRLPKVLSHEKIHSLHLNTADDPFWAEKLKSVPKTFKSVLAKVAPLEQRLTGNKKNWVLEEGRKYFSTFMEDITGKTRRAAVDSERLAYSYQGSGILKQAEKAGLPSFDRAGAELAKAVAARKANLFQKVLAPGRTAQISGLAEGGLAGVFRKIFTAFGSPWQAKFTPEVFEGSSWFPSSEETLLKGKPGTYNVFRGATEKNLLSQWGTYSTPSMSYAKHYGDSSDLNMREFFKNKMNHGNSGTFKLEITTNKPLLHDSDEYIKLSEEYNKLGHFERFNVAGIEKEQRDFLINKGYDSIITNRDSSANTVTLIGLDPDKIKIKGLYGDSEYKPDLELIHGYKKENTEISTNKPLVKEPIITNEPIKTIPEVPKPITKPINPIKSTIQEVPKSQEIKEVSTIEKNITSLVKKEIPEVEKTAEVTAKRVVSSGIHGKSGLMLAGLAVVATATTAMMMKRSDSGSSEGRGQISARSKGSRNFKGI